MESINEPCVPSKVVTTIDAAVDFAKEITYPVIVRPAFTLGGTGGGIAENEKELATIAENGLRSSPITQILVEKCISGWKEIEFEVIRDSKGNVITVCSMENVDPVGVHTGDSIVVAPCVTLSDKDFHMMRDSAMNIVEALGIEGGCNVQYALNPNSFEYAVIEVNPRVSRSSALASKATGYPIAKVAARIAVGYTLDEIVNAVTGTTYACCEPALDYLVVKFPKWPFDKFVYAKKTLGTQMKATGEVMAIGTNFESALMKAVRGAELGMDTLSKPEFAKLSDEEITARLSNVDVDRLFCIFEALKRGVSEDKIHEITFFDRFFIRKLKNLVDLEKEMSTSEMLTQAMYDRAKEYGYLDKTVKKISGKNLPTSLKTKTAVYKTVDTCAAEYKSQTPYFYGSYDIENEAAEFIAKTAELDKKKVVVFGSGPIRIGQGIEFDYCSVHCVWALKEMGYEAVICNNNPERYRLTLIPLTGSTLNRCVSTML
jgi:carbamoyl-phosphate synthase large subunit